MPCHDEKLEIWLVITKSRPGPDLSASLCSLYGTHIYTHILAHIYLHPYTHIYLHIYTCTYILAHIYTHILAHIHTYTCFAHGGVLCGSYVVLCAPMWLLCGGMRHLARWCVTCASARLVLVPVLGCPGSRSE